MGMYDHLSIRIPSEYWYLEPNETILSIFGGIKNLQQSLDQLSQNPSTYFQTKSFDCTMSRYIISYNGFLIRERREFKSQPNDNPQDKSPLSIFHNHVHTKSIFYREPYHGILKFHNIISHTPTSPDTTYLSFHAKFTNGLLEYISDD